MAERQVTVDGTSYQLPDPFIVIATQNPTEQIGVAIAGVAARPFRAVLQFACLRLMLRLIACCAIRHEQFEHGTPVLAAGRNGLCAKCHAITFSDPIIAYVQQLASQLRAASLPNLSVRALIQVVWRKPMR